MKKLLLYTFLLCTTGAFAQLPNSGFENWTNDGNGNINPDGWITSNDQSSSYVPVTQAAPYAGTYGMKVATVSIASFNVPAVAMLQTPINQRPSALEGYYNGIFQPGDSSYISAIFTKESAGLGAGTKYFSKNQASYKKFTIAIDYATGDTPDSMSIIIGSGQGGATTPGASITVDEFTLNMGATGIEMPLNTLSTLSAGITEYGETQLKLYINNPASSNVQVALYNIMGQSIYSQSNPMAEGRHEIIIPVKAAAGAYILGITGANGRFVQKIMVN